MTPGNFFLEMSILNFILTKGNYRLLKKMINGFIKIGFGVLETLKNVVHVNNSLFIEGHDTL